jgi:tRNA modification GTPase
MSAYAYTRETIAAIATPPGVGALGVIRVSGEETISAVQSIFKGADLSKAKGYTLHFGRVIWGEEVIDEVLLSLFRTPKSYTGEDLIEISCHGSPFILGKVLELLMNVGVRLARPGEFTMRAFLNGKMDLSQAEAVADLIASDSESAHKMAIEQMRGGFKKRIGELRSQLIHFASMIELELDFGEEDVEFANRDDLKSLVLNILKIVQELIGSFKYGNVLKNGVYTVIAGRPNAGKSTLLNALLNEERAIVSDIAGTTRDTIEELLNINGVVFRLADTAGIREAQDQIEAMGVQRTMESIDRSSLLVYVYDASAMTNNEVKADLGKLTKPGLSVLVIANKSDLLTQISVIPKDHILISAIKSIAIEQVKDAMFRNALKELPPTGSVVVGNLRHMEALGETKKALIAVIAGLESGLSQDMLAFDMREALHHLGLISGEVTTEDLLENIFRNFCIGK